MTSTRTALCLAIAALTAGAAQAAPVVLDFNAASGGGATFTMQEDGFSLSYSGPTSQVNGGPGNCSPQCVDSGSRYFMTWGGAFTVRSAAGSLFALTAFDGAETFMGVQGLWAQNIRVTGSKADGSTVQQDFALDFLHDGSGPNADFQTFTLSAGFSNLASVTFSNYSPSSYGYMFSLDNIVINGEAAKLAVPEPGSLVLSGLALLALAGAKRAGLAGRPVKRG